MEAKQTRMIRRVGWECGAEKDVVRRKKNDCEGENTRGNNHTWQKETVYDLWWDEALIKMQQNKIVACLHRIWVGDLAFLCNSHFEVTLLTARWWNVVNLALQGLMAGQYYLMILLFAELSCVNIWPNNDQMLIEHSPLFFHCHSFVVHGVLWSNWVHTFLRLDHGSNPESCSTCTFKTGERRSCTKLEAAIYNLPQEKYNLIIGASITKCCCLDSNVSPIVQTANVLPPCNLLPVDDEDELLFETISEECQQECIADFIDVTGAEVLALILSLFKAIHISAQKLNALKRPNFVTSLFNLL